MNIWDLMDERFGKDNVLALATLEDGLPAVRYVNAYYECGAFYIITYALSGKMGQLAAGQPFSIAVTAFIRAAASQRKLILVLPGVPGYNKGKRGRNEWMCGLGSAMIPGRTGSMWRGWCGAGCA